MTHVALSERCSGITALGYDIIPRCVCVGGGDGTEQTWARIEP